MRCSHENKMFSCDVADVLMKTKCSHENKMFARNDIMTVMRSKSLDDCTVFLVKLPLTVHLSLNVIRIHGRSHLFIDGGGSWGNINLSIETFLQNREKLYC